MKCLGTIEVEIKFLSHKMHTVAYVTPDIDDVILPWSAMVELEMIPATFPFRPGESGEDKGSGRNGDRD